MANATDPLARSVHGTDPQYLVDKITRTKIYDTMYWKDKCFGLNAESMLDRAVELDAVGGTYGATKSVSQFLCLVLKSMQTCDCEHCTVRVHRPKLTVRILLLRSKRSASNPTRHRDSGASGDEQRTEIVRRAFADRRNRRCSSSSS